MTPYWFSELTIDQAEIDVERIESLTHGEHSSVWALDPRDRGHLIEHVVHAEIEDADGERHAPGFIRAIDSAWYDGDGHHHVESVKSIDLDNYHA